MTAHTLPDAGYLGRLYAVVEARRNAPPQESYIGKLFAKGRVKIAQKLGEEAVEAALAAVGQEKANVIDESADLLFHWLVLLVECGVSVEEVFAEMQRREGISGLDEKKSRQKRSEP